MRINEKYDQEISIISKSRITTETTFIFSNILLFREYQSRLFAWKVALNFDGNDFFNKRKSYHNLFLDLNPVWIEELIPEDKIVTDLNSAGWDNIRSGFREYMGYFMFLFVNWGLFEEKEEIKRFVNLSHPYEPLFMILRRRGLIDFSDNKFVINGQTYLKYDNNFKLPSTDDDFLDFVDTKATDFPNQDAVNDLWSEYQTLQSNKLKNN
ncbi:hypothetical protein ABID99_000726 [Mucilaginibacter sp. OAE612]|uniref:hypothetical protein n=1 Tax=Mucilaginibacter sp. OAE612 TaxID=3156444 RepID=UPI00359E59C5